MNSKYRGLRLASALICLASMRLAAADDDCKGPSNECVPVGGWNFSIALGAGVRTDPVIHESNIPLVVIPQVSYYGEHFFLDDFDLGWSFIDSDRSTLSLVATPGYDRVYFYRHDFQNFLIPGLSGTYSTIPPTGPAGTTGGNGNGNGSTGSEEPTGNPKKFTWHARDITYLAGPEWTFKAAGLTGQLDLLHEITGHNHGDEIRAALGIALGKLGGGSWAADVGLTWKSSAIVNYYYGSPGVYDGGAVLDPFLKLGYSHPLKGKWKFNGFVECERLGNGIADSPIINQRVVTTAFVGTVYSF